jgi:hypothetical protein
MRSLQNRNLKKENLSFLPRQEQGMTSGQALIMSWFREDTKLFLSSRRFKKVIDHVCHGTMI